MNKEKFKKYKKVFGKYIGIGIFTSILSLIIVVGMVDYLHMPGIYVWTVEVICVSIFKFILYDKFKILKVD